jgi:hypothetical protein
MARLFIGPREQQFINDITKEFVKDIVGQYIVYYPISVIHTQIHEIYEEAIEKVFENPIKIEVLAGQPERSNKFDKFEFDEGTKIELFIQSRDLLDKGLHVFAGDFFIYGREVFEITQAIDIENIFGQAEYEKAVKISGILARSGEFDVEDFKNMLEQSKNFSDSRAQKTFVQQRGSEENEEGNTNDFRELRDRLGDGMGEIALGEGPRKVDEDLTDESGTPLDVATPAKGSGFYNE